MELSVKFTEKELENLRQKVKNVLSEKRYKHTLGVERASVVLAKYFPEIDASELRAAALLHDITKELSDDGQLEIMTAHRECFTDFDMKSPSVYHSFTAPYAVERHFSDFATENVLSAVRNHTTGESGMSLFDELIFISDYVEDGRIYDSCVEVRERLFSRLSSCKTDEERRTAIHRASLESIENTIISVLKQGRKLNERTLNTREYLLCQIGE